VDGKIDGRQIPFTAQNTIKAIVDLNFKRISTSIGYLYRSESFHRSLQDASGNLLSSDPYGVINLFGRYVIVDRERFEAGCFVKITNLLNSMYYNVPIGGAESIKMAPQDPIRFLLGIQLQFQ
jgi:hypothetical protein